VAKKADSRSVKFKKLGAEAGLIELQSELLKYCIDLINKI
jgi:hypothetical protein